MTFLIMFRTVVRQLQALLYHIKVTSANFETESRELRVVLEAFIHSV